MAASHPELGDRWLYCDGAPPLLFTENETNTERLFDTPNASPYVKDAFHAFVVHGKTDAVNPAQAGTKAAAHYRLEVGAGQSVSVRLCLTDAPREPPVRRVRQDDRRPGGARPTSSTDPTRRSRRARTPRWSCARPSAACSGRSRTYFFDVNMWLREHGVHPLHSPASVPVRNRQWFHMFNDDVISMPDKWEYPWYAAWDLAFHAVALAGVDPDFAKHQLNLMLKARYQHPNGQLPAYEWNFGDVNPPVHAWATLFQYRIEQAQRGEGDLEFLKRAFGKLVINFTWWVNRKDRLGKSVFEGGFLGLDNIGVFDRSAELPTGGHLEQADGTAWMAMFCQNMLEIAVELAAHDASYDDLAYKFAEHFLWIGAAMNKVGRRRHVGRGGRVLLRRPAAAGRQGGAPQGPLAGRAVAALRHDRDRTVAARARAAGRRGVADALPPHSRARGRHSPGWSGAQSSAGRTIAARRRPDRLRRILSRMLDEQEFLSPHGIRSVSRWHEAASLRRASVGTGRNTQRLLSAGRVRQRDVRRELQLARPVWFPMNVLLIRALFQFHAYYGDSFRVECPDRLRHADDALRGRRPRSPSGCSASSCATTSRAGVRCSAAREVPERSALARLHSVLRVLPRRQRRRSRRQPPDRVDGTGRGPGTDRTCQRSMLEHLRVAAKEARHATHLAVTETS